MVTSLNQDLQQRAAHRGYTPGATDIAPLLDLLGAAPVEDEVKTLEQALLRAGAAVAGPLLERLPDSVRPARARYVQLAGRLAEDFDHAALRRALLGLLQDHDLKAKLNAIAALGRWRSETSEQALLQLLAGEPRPEVAKAVVRSLGKVGGAKAQAALSAGQGESRDPSLELKRARLILRRELSRQETGRIHDSVPLMVPEVWLSCRQGLESLLVAEARAAKFRAVRVVMPGLVSVAHRGPLRDFWRLRLFQRLSVPFPTTGRVPRQFLKTFASPAVQAFLHALTQGPIRYRLAMPEKSKAELWRLVEQLQEGCPALINDPTTSLWEVSLRQVEAQTYVEWAPKGLPDPRFTYRQEFVPAASHPTLAAALARVAGVRAQDSIWDPFVGSGSELIECHRLAPGCTLFGSDRDEAALAVARTNAGAAGVTLHLTLGDAVTWNGPRPSLTITNPPMGRRVQRGTLHELFNEFMPKAAEHLAPGGRLVWLSPLPARTRAGMEALGLQLKYAELVDMGGFTAELQRWDKPL